MGIDLHSGDASAAVRGKGHHARSGSKLAYATTRVVLPCRTSGEPWTNVPPCMSNTSPALAGKVDEGSGNAPSSSFVNAWKPVLLNCCANPDLCERGQTRNAPGVKATTHCTPPSRPKSKWALNAGQPGGFTLTFSGCRWSEFGSKFKTAATNPRHVSWT